MRIAIGKLETGRPKAISTCYENKKEIIKIK
jgi:hypothetical protein